MTFTQVFKIIAANEGGYSNKAADRGGETYRGIARNFHPTWVGWATLDRKKKAMGGKIPWNWTDAELDTLAMPFYQKQWNDVGMDRFPAGLRAAIFDSYVNSGQNTWGIIRDAAGQKWDRSFVPGLYELAKTISLDKFTQARKSYFEYIAKNNPSQQEFLKGWLDRAEHVKGFILKNPGISIAGVFFLLGVGYLGYKMMKKK